MKDSEKTENNINAREIIANLLHALGLNAPSLAIATGIAYQRIFDLQRGRTKKFSPAVVNQICAAFPMVNKAYLYTGEGNILGGGEESIEDYNPKKTPSLDHLAKMLDKVLELSRQLSERQNELDKKYAEMLAYERSLLQREMEMAKRELTVLRQTGNEQQA